MRDMNVLEAGLKRLWFGLRPELRRSRFHTQKGDFALRTRRDAADCAVALATALTRKAFGWRPVMPWFTLPAVRFLKARLTPAGRVFEWGSGMSTLWFERRCREVHSVESDPEWFRIVASRARRAKVYRLQGPAYVEKLTEFPPGYFDVIVVDGLERLSCYRLAVQRLRPGGILVVDNSDNDRTTGGDLFVIDQMLHNIGPEWQVHRFPGWGLGNSFVWETTVCLRR